MKRIGQYLLSSHQKAAIAALLAALLPLIGFPGHLIALAIVGLVTLDKGAKAGLGIVAWVALPAICFLVLKQVGLIDFQFIQYVIMWLLAMLLRQFQSWGMVLEGLALLMVLAIAGLHLFTGDLTAWWTVHMHTLIGNVSSELSSKEQQELNQFVTYVSPYATGFVAFGVTGFVILMLMFARWWQSVIEEQRLMYAGFLQTRIAIWFAILGIVMVLLACFHISFAMDCLPMILMPFAISGLALLHFFADKKRILLWPVVAVYFAFVFLGIIIISLLALIGFLDTWFHFRKKFIQTLTTSTE